MKESMKSNRKSRLRWACVLVSFVAGPYLTAAIETTGTVGAPDATTTISGKQLPAPQPEFKGKITHDALTSKEWWAPRIVPPKDAPNILLILTDDAGFAVPSTFGGASSTTGPSFTSTHITL